MMYSSFFLLFFVPSFVYGVSNSSVSSINKDPCHYCNIDLNCHYTDLGIAVKSLESKVDSLFKQNNKSFGIGNAIKSLEAKVESLTRFSNNTSGVGDSVKTFEEKMESFLGLNNKTFEIGDAVKSLDAKVEGFSGLINKTSGVADALKYLEVKMDNVLINKTLESKIESLSELRNKTSRIDDAVKSLEAKVQNLIALIYRTSSVPQAAPKRAQSGNLKRKVLISANLLISKISFDLCNILNSVSILGFSRVSCCDRVSSCRQQHTNNYTTTGTFFLFKDSFSLASFSDIVFHLFLEIFLTV